jgi:Protein phosphatase 2C
MRSHTNVARTSLIAVVSDGAGSASEGARGAAFICNEFQHQVQRILPELGSGTNSRLAKGQHRSHARWSAAEADRVGLPPRQLAAALLCAVLAEQWSSFAQVGDGAIVTSEAGTGTWAWLFWPDRGEYANTTSLLTDPSAMQMLQLDTLPHALHEVALFSGSLSYAAAGHLALGWGRIVSVRVACFVSLGCPWGTA